MWKRDLLVFIAIAVFALAARSGSTYAASDEWSNDPKEPNECNFAYAR